MRATVTLLTIFGTLALAVPATACVPATSVQTRIGVMANGILKPAARTATEKALGVAYSRPNAALIDATAPQAQNASSQAAGLATVLTIINRGPGNGPAQPPTDLVAYSAGVRRQLSLNRPALAVIENEEIAPKFYSGTPQDYLAELGAAVRVAHEMGYQVTNGGLVSQAVALMTWNDLWSRGLRAEADRYGQRVFTGSGGSPRILAGLPDSDHSDRPILANAPDLLALLDRAKLLVAGYRASKMDYVNFHWYHRDTTALAQSVEYLERATGKVAVTNEIGQYERSPASVTSVLQTLVGLHLPYVIWYAADGKNAYGLFGADRVLRPNGVAFRDYALAHRYGRPPAGSRPCPRRPASVTRIGLARNRITVRLTCHSDGQTCTGTVSAAARQRSYRIAPGRSAIVRFRVPATGGITVRVTRDAGRPVRRRLKR